MEARQQADASKKSSKQRPVCLRSLKDLERFTVSAIPPPTPENLNVEHTAGDVGSVVDLLLDDERWVVRYLIVRTTGFFNGRDVLISPISFRKVDWSSGQFHLALTKEQVRGSPSTDVDKPVSRQYERDYYGYYGYPYYWGYGVDPWGMWPYPEDLAAGDQGRLRDEHSDEGFDDIHLRSAKELRGYHVQGSDEAIGHVADFIVDDRTWEIRYLVVDTSNWWVGKKVLIAPQWVSRISWGEGKVFLDMSRQAIKDSPELNDLTAITREYEERLHAHHGRPGYWTGVDRQEKRTQSTRRSTVHP